MLMISPYRYPANYSASRLCMTDVALNEVCEAFSDSATTHAPVWAEVITADPDVTEPELDLNNLTVAASPTNPDAPNGETVVTIDYWARDDKSGLGSVSYRLLDPQGTSHFEYHYHNNFYTTFFAGNASAWAPYRISVVLPAGSAPGTWGVESITLQDKVDNEAAYSFVENMHFQALGEQRRLGELAPPRLMGSKSRDAAERAGVPAGLRFEVMAR